MKNFYALGWLNLKQEWIQKDLDRSLKQNINLAKIVPHNNNSRCFLATSSHPCPAPVVHLPILSHLGRPTFHHLSTGQPKFYWYFLAIQTDLVFAADEPVHHFGCRLSAHCFSTGVAELEGPLILVFEQAQYTIYQSKQSPGSRMGDSMALTHNLSYGLVESDSALVPPGRWQVGFW